MIPARVEAEMNRLGNTSASAQLASEVVNTIAEISAVCFGGSDSAKADAPLSAIAMADTETVQLRKRLDQLEALVAAPMPTDAVGWIEHLPDCEHIGPIP
jgi:hypothetical protein